jgi:hypothetical protein
LNGVGDMPTGGRVSLQALHLLSTTFLKVFSNHFLAILRTANYTCWECKKKALCVLANFQRVGSPEACCPRRLTLQSPPYGFDIHFVLPTSTFTSCVTMGFGGDSGVLLLLLGNFQY